MKKDREKFLFGPPKRRTESESEPDKEEYLLTNPSDFSEFCELIVNETATERHHDEFTLRLIQHFIDSVYDEKVPEYWVTKALANSFFKVLQGGRWEDEFPLPWTKTSLPYTAAEWQSLAIFCHIASSVKLNPDAKVTAIIQEVANAMAVSYETARAAYYKHKLLIKNDLNIVPKI
ncbi:MAG: hypothetical protein ACYCY1_02550 [Sulfuriferula sp.]